MSACNLIKGFFLLKRFYILYTAGLLAALGVAPLRATVTITSLTPSVASPQPLGTTVTWQAKATNTAPGNLTFQFNVTPSWRHRGTGTRL